MTEEVSDNETQVLATFEVKVRPGANVEEALALQARLHEIAENTPTIGKIEGRNCTTEDGALMIVYTFRSREAMREFVRHPDHLEAMRRGKEFFSYVRTQVATLEKQNLTTWD